MHHENKVADKESETCILNAGGSYKKPFDQILFQSHWIYLLHSHREHNDELDSILISYPKFVLFKLLESCAHLLLFKIQSGN